MEVLACFCFNQVHWKVVIFSDWSSICSGHATVLACHHLVNLVFDVLSAHSDWHLLLVILTPTPGTIVLTVLLVLSDKTVKLWKISERDKRPEGYNLKYEDGRVRDPTTITALRVRCHALSLFSTVAAGWVLMLNYLVIPCDFIVKERLVETECFYSLPNTRDEERFRGFGEGDHFRLCRKDLC